MKILSLILLALGLSSLGAQTIFTSPQGYSRITIAGSDANGAKLTSFSVTLLNEGELAGQVTINDDFNADPDGDPSTPDASQTIFFPGASWTADHWTTPNRIIFLTDRTGAKEAFLITGNTSDVITVSPAFDLLGDSDPDPEVAAPRFPSSTSAVIRKATTIASIFESVAASFGPEDRVYLWGGNRWQSYRYATFWRNIDDSRTNANNDIVFPDEGVFVLRQGAGEMVLTIFGEVETAPAVTTVSSQGFSSTRFPIETTLAGFGAQFSNWSPNDRLYLWNPTGQEWTTYRYRTDAFWVNVDDSRTNADNEIIAANSAVFIARENPLPAIQAGITSQLPFDPNLD